MSIAVIQNDSFSEVLILIHWPVWSENKRQNYFDPLTYLIRRINDKSIR